jgi:hypothetical protein
MRSDWPRSRMASRETRPPSSPVVGRDGLSGLSRRRPRVRVPSLPLALPARDFAPGLEPAAPVASMLPGVRVPSLPFAPYLGRTICHKRVLSATASVPADPGVDGRKRNHPSGDQQQSSGGAAARRARCGACGDRPGARRLTRRSRSGACHRRRGGGWQDTAARRGRDPGGGAGAGVPPRAGPPTSSAGSPSASCASCSNAGCPSSKGRIAPGFCREWLHRCGLSCSMLPDRWELYAVQAPR